MRAITCTGKLKVTERTRSVRPSSMKVSISSLTTRATRSSSQRSSILERKLDATRVRMLRCSGSSICRMVRPITMPITSS